jgi:hypothetical protein
MTRLRFVFVCLLGALALIGFPGSRLAAQAPAAPNTDISGFWELNFDGRKVPRANLVPKVTPAMVAEKAKRDEYAIRWCNSLGMPFFMDNGRPLDIRVGATGVILAPEFYNSPRYLYLNRKTHIGEDIYDPSTYGDSVARWEGSTLVVETVGFHPDRGITAIPGGGYKTATSRLTERYSLLENGQILSVVFTWTDPNMFQTPHTYEFRYHRLPASYEARPWLPCDPYNETRAKFLEGK